MNCYEAEVFSCKLIYRTIKVIKFFNTEMSLVMVAYIREFEFSFLFVPLLIPVALPNVAQK